MCDDACSWHLSYLLSALPVVKPVEMASNIVTRMYKVLLKIPISLRCSEVNTSNRRQFFLHSYRSCIIHVKVARPLLTFSHSERPSTDSRCSRVQIVFHVPAVDAVKFWYISLLSKAARTLSSQLLLSVAILLILCTWSRTWYTLYSAHCRSKAGHSMEHNWIVKSSLISWYILTFWKVCVPTHGPRTAGSVAQYPLELSIGLVTINFH